MGGLESVLEGGRAECGSGVCERMEIIGVCATE